MARRHWLATLALVLLIGLSVGVVGAAMAAARRADGSLGRMLAHNRVYDRLVFSCPPGVDPNALESQTAISTTCLSEERARQTVADLVSMPEVETATYGAYHVAAMLDPSSPNGWGQVGLLTSTKTRDSAFAEGRPLVVEGRLPRSGAADEIVISERTLRSGQIQVGQAVQLASWSTAHLDEGVNGGLPPETRPVTMRVVGAVRFPLDLSPPGADDISGNFWAGELHAVGGSAAAFRDFASYGTGALVSVRGGRDGIEAFEGALAKRWADRFFLSQPVSDTDPAAIEKVIDTERRAVIAFAAIALLATLGFAGLTLLRQLRHEQADAPSLIALGLTRRHVVTASVVRSVVIAVPASLVAVVAAVALSPFGPVGVARRAEPRLGFHADIPVLAASFLFTSLFVVVIAAVAPSVASRLAARTALPPFSIASRAGRLGPVARAGVMFAVGSWPRTAAVTVALAISALVVAGVTVTSLDRVVSEPNRYGAWWDVSMGEFSDPGPLASGVDIVRAEPAVRAAAGIDEQTGVVKLDGRAVVLFAFTPYVGAPSPVMLTGRPPASETELALGRATQRALDVEVGDTVRLVPSESGDVPPIEMTVTGIVLLNDPVTLSHDAGEGAVVLPEVVDRVVGGVPQQILVRFDRGADIDATVRRLARSFTGPIKPVTPNDDLRNMQRLRAVPWLIGALIGILALATTVHALTTMVLRHRRDLALLAVFGVVGASRTRATAWASAYLIIGAALAGLPLGIVAGRVLWRSLASGVDIPAGPTVGTVGPLLIVIAAVAMSQSVTWLATRRLAHVPVADLLRAE